MMRMPVFSGVRERRAGIMAASRQGEGGSEQEAHMMHT